MIRETSRAIFKEILENGLLAKVETDVYEAVMNNEELSIKEACLIISHRPETTVSPAFARLERQDAIFTAKKKICSVTGNLVHSWETTGRRPVKLEKETKLKCKHCDGKGYVSEQQTKMF